MYRPMRECFLLIPTVVLRGVALVALIWGLQAELRGREATRSSRASGRQWQVVELTFVTPSRVADPFDFKTTCFSAEFHGPGGEEIRIPGFWDGAGTWKLRFTPTAPGLWTYTTSYTSASDASLHRQRGTIDVGPAEGHALWQHGGFLKVSANHRYLTYTDGTPFFWLADTWWTCPSAKIPFESFRRLVDTRLEQGYTVFQAHGFRALRNPQGVNAFQAVQTVGEGPLAYWRAVDTYYAYAAQSGILGIVGFYGGWSLSTFTYENHERLWHYFLARYGAYPITFLITQEYNVMTPQTTGKGYDERFVELGSFIKAHDPYGRAMSVHPWAQAHDNRRAWAAPWHDFTLLQAGHFTRPRADTYWDIYFRTPAKPLVQSEQNYEGFLRDSFSADAACIRDSAYTAIQGGCFGFSYGAQGLYGGVVSRDQPGPTARWGPVLTWDEGLALPGGRQLQHLRSFYETLDWWRLTPSPGACCGDSRILVKSDRAHVFVLWFPEEAKRPGDLRLLGARCRGSVYSALWFNPRDGVSTTAVPVRAPGDDLVLPRPPDERDWLLVLRHEDGGVVLPSSAAEWSFADDAQGWTVEQHVGGLQVAAGALCGNVTGPDPILLSPGNLNTKLSSYPVVEIDLYNATPLTEARIYFRTSASDTFFGNSVSFDMAAAQDGFVAYRVDMTSHRHWYGWLRQLRVDPGDFRNTGIEPTGTFAIRSVRLVNAVQLDLDSRSRNP